MVINIPVNTQQQSYISQFIMAHKNNSAVPQEPWSTDDIRRNADKWSLAGDAGLLSHLQHFSNTLETRSRNTISDLDDLFTSLMDTSIVLSSVNNQFMGLHHTQFIESRVYEEDETVIENPPENAIVDDSSKSTDTGVAENIEMTKKIVEEGLRILDQHFERVQVPNSDSEGESEGPSIIVHPKDMYMDRQLPYVIGSAEWYAHDHVGLQHADSSETIDDQGNDSDSCKLSSEYNLPHSTSSSSFENIETKEESIFHTDRIREPDFLPANSKQEDMFGSSSDNDSNVNQTDVNTTNVNAKFAAELAAKLGNVVEENKTMPILPSDNDVYGVPKTTQTKMKKSEARKLSDGIFGDEPPPLDEVDQIDIFGRSAVDNNYLSSGGLFDDLDDDDDSLWAGNITKSLHKQDPKVRTKNSTMDGLFGDKDGFMDVDNDIFSNKANKVKKENILFNESDDLFSNIYKSDTPYFPVTNVRTADPLISDQPPPDIEENKSVGETQIAGRKKENISKLAKVQRQSSSDSESDVSDVLPADRKVLPNPTKRTETESTIFKKTMVSSENLFPISKSTPEMRKSTLFSDDESSNSLARQYDNIFGDDDSSIDFLISKKGVFGDKEKRSTDLFNTVTNDSNIFSSDDIPSKSLFDTKTDSSIDLFKSDLPTVSTLSHNIKPINDASTSEIKDKDAVTNVGPPDSLFQDDSKDIFANNDIFTSNPMPKASPRRKPLSLFDNESPPPVSIPPTETAAGITALFSESSTDIFSGMTTRQNDSLKSIESIFAEQDVMSNVDQFKLPEQVNTQLEDIFQTEKLLPKNVQIDRKSQPADTDDFSLFSGCFHERNSETISDLSATDEVNVIKSINSVDRNEVAIPPISVKAKSLEIEGKIDDMIHKKPRVSTPPGKMSHNLNINVAALLPGAVRPKSNQPKDVTSPKKDASSSEIETPEISPKTEPRHSIAPKPEDAEVKTQPIVIKSVSFDESPQNLDTLQSLTQERVRIRVKRRPSSRKARKQALRNSTVDLNDNTETDDQEGNEQAVNDNNDGENESRPPELKPSGNEENTHTREVSSVVRKVHVEVDNSTTTSIIERKKVDDGLFDSPQDASHQPFESKASVLNNNTRIMNSEEINRNHDISPQPKPPSFINPLSGSASEDDFHSNDYTQKMGKGLFQTEPRSSSDLFGDDLFTKPASSTVQNDLFAGLNESSPTKKYDDSNTQKVVSISDTITSTTSNLTTEVVVKKTEPVKKSLDTLFGDDDDDDFLFTGKLTGITKDNKAVFDNTPEDDLFSNKVIDLKSSALSSSKSLFGNDVDDLFGNTPDFLKETQNVVRKISKSDNIVSKVRKATSTVVSADPLMQVEGDE